MTENTEAAAHNFITEIIDADIESGKHDGKVTTRFPPEPNGYLHIGHAKSICLNFGLAKQYNGTCHLRFDDTNPVKEEQHYIDAIKEDLRWLGFDWGEHEYYASDYFDKLHDFAIKLIKTGKAYVDDQTPDQIRLNRGDLKNPGQDSPFRNRSVDENLEHFSRMRAGDFKDGEKVLRAKIDMAAPNINLRDPIMYRILHATHHKTGDKWCIYPMYDFTHGQSDSLEGITYSLCSLEFEDHRPLYEWFIQALEIFPSRQIEFARMNVNYTIMSKRKLLDLVEQKRVDGWDDPRMPTLSGMRRRGYPAAAIRQFCEKVGIAKRNNIIDMALLEHCVRDELNTAAHRAMAVLNPLKVIIDNYPEGEEETLEAVNNPEDESAGTRKVPFSKVLYIEREDFMEDPPKKFFRLGPGREVRLRYAYFITCNKVVHNAEGEVEAIHCSYDPETKGGNAPDGRKVKGTLHWVSAQHAVPAKVNLYDRLFSVENPVNKAKKKKGDFTDYMNPESLQTITAQCEPSLANATQNEHYQFERMGYFYLDKNSDASSLTFNRTATLRDSWAKQNKS